MSTAPRMNRTVGVGAPRPRDVTGVEDRRNVIYMKNGSVRTKDGRILRPSTAQAAEAAAAGGQPSNRVVLFGGIAVLVLGLAWVVYHGRRHGVDSIEADDEEEGDDE